MNELGYLWRLDTFMKILRIAALMLAAGAFVRPAIARAQPLAASASEQFFIISSVDQKKKELVLKLPTEVTQLMRVSDSTVYLGEDGKPIEFGSLRAGDTVYINSERGADGVLVARRIRKGPMTLEELHRRYLSGSP